MKNIAIYPGSFDPLTKGHENIIERASKMFDELYVCVGINPDKKDYVFTPEERVELINKVIKKYDNVKALSYNCLTVEVAETLNASTIIKGLRNSIDFQNELYQASVNKNLNKNIETLLLVTDEKCINISSTLTKEKARNNEDISQLIPSEILEEVKAKIN